MTDRMFPAWVTEQFAEQCEKTADSLERWAGPEAAEESRELAEDLRALLP